MPVPVSEKLFRYQLFEAGGETTFGVASSNLDYVECAAPIDRGGLTEDSLMNEKSRQRMTQYARIIGRKNGSVTVRLHGQGFSTAVPSAAVSLTASTASGATAFDHIMAMMGSALGNVIGGGYADGTIGYSDPDITEDDLTSFTVGQGITWATGDATNPYETNFITTNTVDTPDAAGLIQTPQHNPQGTKAWGGYTAFMKTADVYHAGTTKSFTLKMTYHDGIFTAVGCRPTAVSFTAAVGELPYWDITYNVANWTYATASALPAEGAFAFPDPEAALLWNVALGGDAGDPLITSGFTVDFGLAVSPVPDGGAAGGIGGWYTTARDPSISLQIHREDNSDLGDYEAQTVQTLVASIGSQPGQIISFCGPSMVIADKPTEEDGDGSVMQTFNLKPVRYTGDTGTEADGSPIDTDFRVFWG